MSHAALAQCHTVFFKRTVEHVLVATPTPTREEIKKHLEAAEFKGRRDQRVSCIRFPFFGVFLCDFSVPEWADTHAVCTGADIPLPDWTGVCLC